MKNVIFMLVMMLLLVAPFKGQEQSKMRYEVSKVNVIGFKLGASTTSSYINDILDFSQNNEYYVAGSFEDTDNVDKASLTKINLGDGVSKVVWQKCPVSIHVDKIKINDNYYAAYTSNDTVIILDEIGNIFSKIPTSIADGILRVYDGNKIFIIKIVTGIATGYFINPDGSLEKKIVLASGVINLQNSAFANNSWYISFDQPIGGIWQSVLVKVGIDGVSWTKTFPRADRLFVSAINKYVYAVSDSLDIYATFSNVVYCLDTSGNIGWQKQVTYTDSNGYMYHAIASNPNGGVTIACRSYIVNYDDVGNLQWSYVDTSKKLVPEKMLYDANGNLIASGLYYGVGMYLAKYNVDISGTDVKKEDHNSVSSFGLGQNYPNPFNPSTTISYSLKVSNFVDLKVYNSLGIEVAKLVDEHQTAGEYKINFNGSNLPSGVYFYRLAAHRESITKLMILLK